MKIKHDEKKIEEMIRFMLIPKKYMADIIVLMVQYAEYLVKQTEKAFGGCTKCYGKGYSTVKDYTTSHADFAGDKTSNIENDKMRFCSCKRGEQLNRLIQDRVLGKDNKFA